MNGGEINNFSYYKRTWIYSAVIAFTGVLGAILVVAGLNLFAVYNQTWIPAVVLAIGAVLFGVGYALFPIIKQRKIAVLNKLLQRSAITLDFHRDKLLELTMQD